MTPPGQSAVSLLVEQTGRVSTGVNHRVCFPRGPPLHAQAILNRQELQHHSGGAAASLAGCLASCGAEKPSHMDHLVAAGMWHTLAQVAGRTTRSAAVCGLTSSDEVIHVSDGSRTQLDGVVPEEGVLALAFPAEGHLPRGLPHQSAEHTVLATPALGTQWRHWRSTTTCRSDWAYKG